MTEPEARLPLLFRVRMARRELANPESAAVETTSGARSRSSLALPTFQTIYRQYFDFVWSCAARFGVAPSAMDDMVQEVFVVVHAKLDTLQNPEALRSWIYGVVRRIASHHRRAQRTRNAATLAMHAEGEASSTEPTPLEQVERNAELSLLASLLNELDEAKREMFALVELDELSVPEAAAALDIPLNTAYSRLRAARQAFDQALARHHARSNRT